MPKEVLDHLFVVIVVWSLNCVQLLWPHGLSSARLLCPWDFSGKEYCSRLPFLPPGNLPDPGIDVLQWQGNSLPRSHRQSPDHLENFKNNSLEIAMYTLIYLKWITNKVLPYSTGNSAERDAAAWMEAGFGGEWIHAYAGLSHWAVHLKLSQHL